MRTGGNRQSPDRMGRGSSTGSATTLPAKFRGPRHVPAIWVRADRQFPHETPSGAPVPREMPNQETAGQVQYTGCLRNLSNARTIRGRIFAARAAMKPVTSPVA